MGSRDAQKLLGTRSVPDLRSHPLVAVRQVNRFEFEFYTVGHFWFLFEDAFRYSEKEIRFAHLFITYDDYFVEVVEAFVGVIKRPTSISIKSSITSKYTSIRSNLQAIASRAPATTLIHLLPIRLDLIFL